MQLEDLIDRFRGPLVGLIASWGAPWREATELAQDAFAEAWLSRRSFRGDLEDSRATGAWLRGIARNLLRDRRSSAVRRRAEAIEEVDPEAPREAEDRERARLLEAMGRLSEEHRSALRVHYLEETSVRETAALLGISEKAAESRLYRARRELKRLLSTEAEPERQRS